MTEVIDDIVFARAPIGHPGARDMLKRLRTVKRLPSHLTEVQCALAADFVARFSALAASAPWPRFTLEVNPLKLGTDAAAAVDGLLLIESQAPDGAGADPMRVPPSASRSPIARPHAPPTPAPPTH